MEPSVLIVDDEPDVLQLMCEVLEDEGFRVLPVDHPERVLRVSFSSQPDVVLVDLMLPAMSGIELARRLRRKGLGSTPMIAMSASQGMLDEAQRSSLFDDLLPKPFNLIDLIDRVQSCLERGEQTA